MVVANRGSINKSRSCTQSIEWDQFNVLGPKKQGKKQDNMARICFNLLLLRAFVFFPLKPERRENKDKGREQERERERVTKRHVGSRGIHSIRKL